jgi:hypothetical protein
VSRAARFSEQSSEVYLAEQRGLVSKQRSLVSRVERAAMWPTFAGTDRSACAAHRYSVYLLYRYKSTHTDVPALTARATAKEGVNVRASSHLYFFGGTPPSSEGGVPPESVSELTVSVYGVGVSMCTLVC